MGKIRCPCKTAALFLLPDCERLHVKRRTGSGRPASIESPCVGPFSCPLAPRWLALSYQPSGHGSARTVKQGPKAPPGWEGPLPLLSSPWARSASWPQRHGGRGAPLSRPGMGRDPSTPSHVRFRSPPGRTDSCSVAEIRFTTKRPTGPLVLAPPCIGKGRGARVRLPPAFSLPLLLGWV